MEHEDYGDYCDHKWGEAVHLGKNIWRATCKLCGQTIEDVLYEEHWKNKTITIMGKTYRALKAWGNISRCAECGKVTFGPLVLWSSQDPFKAITFHFECAEKLGILKRIVEAAKARVPI